jgi:hypothetical protein
MGIGVRVHLDEDMLEDFRVPDQSRDIGASFISSATLSMAQRQSRSAMARIGGHEACRVQVAGTRSFLVAGFATANVRAAVAPPPPLNLAGWPTKNSSRG